MAPKLKPPNRLEIVGTPTFSIYWYADPADGTSYVAYSGGGGSARTGVSNKIGVIINDAAEPKTISTGLDVGIALQIYANPLTKKVWMLVSLVGRVRRYSLPDCELDGTLEMVRGPTDSPDEPCGCNCLGINAMTDRLALGCENGNIQIHALSDDTPFGSVTEPLMVLQQHTKAVNAVAFAMRGNKILSCAKDGTACVWQEQDGTLLASLKCEVDPPPQPAKKKVRPRALRIMVRGCAFGDLQGNIFLHGGVGATGQCLFGTMGQG